MKLKTIYKPELAVSKDHSRFNLSNPYLDVENKALVATDGRILVKYDIEVNNTDKSGVLPVEMFKSARKDRVKEIDVHAGNEKVSFVSNAVSYEFKRPELQNGSYCNYQQVLPKGEPKTRIKVNPKNLKAIIDALGKQNFIEIGINGPLDPIEIRVNSVLALLMPMG